MIVSWLFSERKQKKKRCKQEHTLHFGAKSRSLGEKEPTVLLSCPFTRCQGGAARAAGDLELLSFGGEREVRGLGRSLQRLF